LPPVPVDLDELVELLQSGEHHSGGRLNIRTGEALPDLMFAEMADEFHEDEDAEAVKDEWVCIDALGSSEAYRDMERFIASSHRCPPPVDGSHHRKGRLRPMPHPHSRLADLVDAWRLHSEKRWLGRARLWLAEAGYEPA
jgi:hypothetical protein